MHVYKRDFIAILRVCNSVINENGIEIKHDEHIFCIRLVKTFCLVWLNSHEAVDKKYKVLFKDCA